MCVTAISSILFRAAEEFEFWFFLKELYPMVTVKLLSTLSWHSEMGNNECESWWNNFWFDFVLESLENEMQTSSVMWDTTVYNTSFFLLASFLSASRRISLYSFCVSPLGTEGLPGLRGVGAVGSLGKGRSAWPKRLWSCSQRRGWEVEEYPFFFFSFSCLLPKKGLDVECWPITMWVSPHTKKRGGLCKYSQTTEINRAEKKSGKKSARLRLKGFCCWFWVF